MAETVSSALAKVDETPRKIIEQYAADFRAVLPSHIKSETWIRVSTSALRRGKIVHLPRGGECYELELAARNNPLALISALMEAARLGLEPGTEEYYLTPRKVKGKLEILGIVGYQGHIELMYRAGAVSAIYAEVVYAADLFVWKPAQLDTHSPPRWEGPQVVPLHEVDWDTDDRGELRRAYAYARMINGATSRVVVLNRTAIERIKQEAYTAPGSIWDKHESAMWLKSAVRQLHKWVPTSPEWLMQQVKAVTAASADQPVPQLQNSQGGRWDLGDSPESAPDYVDGEIVDHDKPSADSPIVPDGPSVPSSYTNEITDYHTSYSRLLEIHAALKRSGQLGAVVLNENGDEEPIEDMVVRIGTERKAEEVGGHG